MKKRLTSFCSEGSFSDRYLEEEQIDAGTSHSREREVCDLRVRIVDALGPFSNYAPRYINISERIKERI